jgi:hypothetical protein
MGERLRLRSTGLEWRVIEDEIVALDLPSELYLGVNQSGSLLWNALERGATEEELVRALVDRYGVGESDAQRDVAGFLSALRERGVLQSEPG